MGLLGMKQAHSKEHPSSLLPPAPDYGGVFIHQPCCTWSIVNGIIR